MAEFLSHLLSGGVVNLSGLSSTDAELISYVIVVRCPVLDACRYWSGNAG